MAKTEAEYKLEMIAEVNSFHRGSTYALVEIAQRLVKLDRLEAKEAERAKEAPDAPSGPCFEPPFPGDAKKLLTVFPFEVDVNGTTYVVSLGQFGRCSDMIAYRASVSAYGDSAYIIVTGHILPYRPDETLDLFVATTRHAVGNTVRMAIMAT